MSSRESRAVPLFTQVDISAHPTSGRPVQVDVAAAESANVMRDMLTALDRQNELLEAMLNQMTTQQRQREAELKKWRQHHPQLARRCRVAADALGKVHAEYLQAITEEVQENAEDMGAGEFMLSEFVDRFGPRLAHLSGLLHILSQLGRGPMIEEDEDE